MEPIKRVLVVDDDRDIRTIIEETLVASGYDVDTATDSGMALRKIATTHYDLAIVDLMLPDIDGVMLQGKMRVKDPELSSRVIFTTGFTDRAAVLDFLKHQSADLFGTSRSEQVELHAARADVEEVRVRVDEAGNRQGALELDDAGLRSYVLVELVSRADGGNSFSSNRNGFGHGTFGIEGNNFASSEDEVRGCLRSELASEGEGQKEAQ